MNNNDPARVVTGKVRLSYVHLLKPRAAKPGDTPKYSTTLLIPKTDTVTFQKMQAAIQAAIQNATSGKWQGVCPPNPAIPLYDGDGVRPMGEAFSPECKGHWVMTASSEQPPEIVDLSLNKILNPSEIYSGMYAHVSIRFFGYFSSGKKGIGCGLGNVQKVADGDPLGGGQRSAAEDFGGFAPIPGQQQIAQPTYQQAVYPQPSFNTTPVFPQAIQAPVTPVYPQPQAQIDPITGKPILGQVMGL